jgi:hypothetical protein
MPTEMVCARHYTLRTRDGHCISFKPNEPKSVPDSVVAEAMAVNIVPVDRDFVDSPPEIGQGKPIKINISPELRRALVLHVIEDMVRENDKDMFDGGGAPKLAHILERTGLTIVNKERIDFWAQYKEVKATNSEMPNHKLVEPVLEIQYLNTPRDTKEYALAMGVPEKDVIGRSVTEQKKIILAHVLKNT